MKKIKNLFKSPKVKMIVILSILLFIYTTLCAISYAENMSEGLQKGVLRLHVLANSDSEEDQKLKLIVRDNLLKYMNELCKDVSTKQDAISLVEKNEMNFKQIAIDTIKKEGYSYDVNVQLGNFQFPTKKYGDISLPAGYYDALRIEIGEAKGQNWWCVMFPPLCFVDISSGIIENDSKELLKENLDEEEFALISDNSNEEIKFKFKLLEFFNFSNILSNSDVATSK